MAFFRFSRARPKRESPSEPKAMSCHRADLNPEETLQASFDLKDHQSCIAVVVIEHFVSVSC